MPTPPCKNCPNSGCGTYHDKCELYLEFKRKEDERKRKNRELNMIAYDVNARINVTKKKKGGRHEI